MARDLSDDPTKRRWQRACEYLGGAADAPPAGVWVPAISSIWWGVWWFALLLAAVSLAGQASRFIYIDF